MYNDLDIYEGIDKFGVGRVESMVVKESFWQKLVKNGYKTAPRRGDATVRHWPSYAGTPSFSVQIPGSRDCGHEYERFFPVDREESFSKIDAELERFLQPGRLRFHPFF